MIVQQMKRRGGKVQGSLNLRLRVRPSPNQAKRRRRNQINGTRVFRKKRWSDSLFPRECRLISLQYSGMLSISLRAFIAFRPTCFARRLVIQNLHETPTQRARQLYPDSKNNSWRITYGIGCVWGMPSLSPLSSLGINNKNTCFGFQWMKKVRVKKQGLPSEVFSTTAGEIGRTMFSGRSVSHFVLPFSTWTRIIF